MRQLVLIMAFCPILLWGQLRLAKIFSDRMVLQREMEIPVWGSASPGTSIRVEMAGNIVFGTANEQGKWKILFPELKAGGPYTLKISGQSEVITFSDILIGDVWFASGQSNMEHPMQGWEWIPHSEVDRFEAEMTDVDYPEIRLFDVPHYPSLVPLDDLSAGRWEKAGKETVAGFSATAWFFAKSLYKKLKVPIGIIHSSWGGTPIRTWMSRETLKHFINNDLPRESDSISLTEWYDKVNTAIDKNRIYRNQISYPPPGLAATVSKPEIDLTGWTTIDSLNETCHWRKIVWLRKTTIIPEGSAQSLTLSLGFLNRQANIYFNGIELAYIQYPKPAAIEVPPALIRKGINVLIIRLANFMGATQVFGTLSGIPDLDRQWMANDRLEQMDSPTESYQNRPAFLFNGMVAPIIPYGLKGFIWSQGESDAGRPVLYEKLFQTLIADWRRLWGQGDVPFLFVQAANIETTHEFYQQSDSWCLLREAQGKALALPNTGMVVSIDIGDPYDVHPGNKQDFGYRLTLQALKVAYQQKVMADGPAYRSHRTKGDTAIIKFNECLARVKTRQNLSGHCRNPQISHLNELSDLKGNMDCFEIAGEDGLFHKAFAVIRQNKVWVFSMAVSRPIIVRYAWRNNPACCLFNKAGLPVRPFILKF